MGAKIVDLRGDMIYNNIIYEKIQELYTTYGNNYTDQMTLAVG